MSITIREKASGSTLAEADEGAGVVAFEGNWYFDPTAVRDDLLRTTDRTYTCPFKGTCHWVDYVGTDGKTVADVAWVYADPKPGHDAIKGRYGFHAGTRGSTTQQGG